MVVKNNFKHKKYLSLIKYIYVFKLFQKYQKFLLIESKLSVNSRVLKEIYNNLLIILTKATPELNKVYVIRKKY